jgi:hypothetical protein
VTPKDAQNPPQDARNPAPSPDGTTQGLSGAQTGGLGDALRALADQLGPEIQRTPIDHPVWDLFDHFAHLGRLADRLERERDDWRVASMLAIPRLTRVRALVVPLVDGGPTDDEPLTVGQVRAALEGRS